MGGVSHYFICCHIKLSNMWKKKSKVVSHWQGNTHICNFKDTGQRVDRTLNGFQHGPLGGHVLLGRHGNAKHMKRENKKSQSTKRKTNRDICNCSYYYWSNTVTAAKFTHDRTLNVGDFSVQKCNRWKSTTKHKMQIKSMLKVNTLYTL